jgi:hypothetical protein
VVVASVIWRWSMTAWCGRGTSFGCRAGAGVLTSMQARAARAGITVTSQTMPQQRDRMPAPVR